MVKFLKYLLLILALTLTGVVATISVKGLMLVFSGSGILGLLLFSIVEISKVISTSVLHTYNEVLSKLQKGLLSVTIVIAMIITSMGIYGFLSSSYKATFNEMTITNNEVKLIEDKITLLEDSKENINKNINDKNERIIKLNEVVTQKEIRLDSLYQRRWFSSARKTEKSIKETNSDINKLQNDIDSLNLVLSGINDEINNHKKNILETQSNNEASKELGTLRYLSDISGMSMDDVMKYFILLLMVIGDPLAVLMIVIFNKIVNKKEGGNNEPPKDKTETPITTKSSETEEKVIEDSVEEVKETIETPKTSTKKEIVSKDKILRNLEKKKNVITQIPRDRDGDVKNGDYKIFKKQIK